MDFVQEKNHFLLPSLIFAEYESYTVKTILGSCVAVCLYDPVRMTGGINHYMLPWWDGKGLPSPKYGDIAIEKLVERMQALGSMKKNLIAKVFGGASQLGHETGHFQIGARNIATAEKVLGQHAIPIVASSVGGALGRRLIFNTGSGKVLIKTLDFSNSLQDL